MMDSEMLADLNLPSPVQEIRDEWTERAGIALFLKRDDLIHPEISGNKWRKLKFNLEHARKIGASRLLTFGGAYSNHILAFAAAGKRFGFETIGIIRGEAHEPLNPVLSFARQCGMRIGYLDRETYRRKNAPEVLERLTWEFGDVHVIPEGGTNEWALPGCIEIVRELDFEFDILCTACGTGGTLAGLVAGLEGGARALGFAALKGGDFLNADVRKLLARSGYGQPANWDIVTDYHFGGYARKDKNLASFIHWFHEAHGVELDFVYTGKMMYGLFDLTKSGFFGRGTRIVALHTGGVRTAGLAYLD